MASIPGSGLPSSNKINTAMMDSRASVEYMRFEQSSLRLTDERFIETKGEHSASAQGRAAAGMGYGSKHPDHYLYYSFQAPSASQSNTRAAPGSGGHVGTKSTDEVWQEWHAKAKQKLTQPLQGFPDAKVMEAALKPKERETPGPLVDHRFSHHPKRANNPDFPRDPNARALGYGFAHRQHGRYLQAKSVRDVQGSVSAGTEPMDWGTYSRQLNDGNFLNMNV